MATTITFYPVDNGDMTLIRFGDIEETTLLIDVNIRSDADNPESNVRDVAKDLREKLRKDEHGRPYVDSFLLSHPDADHCRGLVKHFYLGQLADYPDDEKEDKDKRILIKEMWSSPIVFRRASKNHVLSDDASAWATEARRRVQVNRNNGFVVSDGDRIQIMGKDIDGKTDDLGPILRLRDTHFNNIAGKTSPYFSAHLIAPLDPEDTEEEEECLAKNQSSVIINFTLAADIWNPIGANFLTGGDAEVFIWNCLWGRHKHEPQIFEYDLLQTPHHCSWHSLANDSWSELKEKAQVDQDAKNALSQTKSGAVIVASSKPIKDDDTDPPCIRAKTEYVSIIQKAKGEFFCTGEYPNSSVVEPLVFTVTSEGVSPPPKKETIKKAAFITTSTQTPRPHG